MTAQTTKQNPTFAVIGGGISGLSAAFYLQKRFPDASITVMESSERLGGVLKTTHRDGFLIEASADMFVSNPPAALSLCQELGIEENLLQTQPVQDRAFIGLGKELFAVPKGLSMMVPTLPQPIHDSNLLTEDGKSRFLGEDKIPAQSGEEDESLKSFAVRRFGIEAYEKIIQPMVSGIYTADPNKLSMHATMQRFVDMERQHGSLITALKQNKSDGDQQASGARYAMFRAPVGGMGTLAEAIVEALPQVTFKSNSAVSNIVNDDGTWTVDGQTFDGVVLSTPAAIAAQLIGGVDPVLTRSLASITTASSAIVVMGIRREQLKETFSGFGIIYPHIDDGQVIALSFSSNKFTGRCDEDHLLIRCFIGGAMQSELVDLEDDALIEIARKQLDQSLGFNGDPIFSQVHRWKNCMPQYHLGHLDRVRQIEEQIAKLRGLEIAGNSYWGVGVPACVASGKAAAERIEVGG